MKKTLTSKRTERNILVNGKLIKMVTVLGLSQIVGKSRRTIQRYEETGVFPPAPVLWKNRRYYSVDLAQKLCPLVNQLPLHKKPDADLLVEINKCFKEERDKYAS